MSGKLNRCLMVVTIVGLGFLLFEFMRGRGVAAERDRLAAIYGRVDVLDPTKMYIQKVPTDTPMDFAWRFYLPEGHQFQEYRSFFRYGGRHTAAYETNHGYCVIRTRLLPMVTGVRLDRIGAGSSSSGTQFRADFGDFLKRHWSDFDISVLADKGQVEIDPTHEIATLVTVTIPDHLQAEAEALIGETQYSDEPSDKLLRIEFGKDSLFEKKP